LCFESPGSTLWQWGFKVSNIEPVTFPLDSLARGMIREVLALILRTKHQLSSTNLGRLSGAGNWTKIEEML